VLRLHRALYGLRQAPRAWNECLTSELAGRGFAQSNADPGLWILESEGGVVLTMFYVDDGMVVGRTEEEAEGVVEPFAAIFETRSCRLARGATGHAGDRDCSGSQGGHDKDSTVRKGTSAGRGVWGDRPATGQSNDTSGAWSFEGSKGLGTSWQTGSVTSRESVDCCKFRRRNACRPTLRHQQERSPCTALHPRLPTTTPCSMWFGMWPAPRIGGSHMGSQTRQSKSGVTQTSLHAQIRDAELQGG
jgi:hypothetical protein